MRAISMRDVQIVYANAMTRNINSLLYFILLCFITTNICYAETSISLQKAQVSLSSIDNEESLLKIQLLGSKSQASVFVIENPTRVVIDVPGYPSKVAKSIKLNDPLFKKLRVGIHRNKIRIVLDSRLANNYSLSLSEKDDTHIIRISTNSKKLETPLSDKLTAPKAAFPKWSPKPKAEPSNEPSPIPSVSPIASSSPAASPSPSSKPVEEPSPSESARVSPSPSASIEEAPSKSPSVSPQASSSSSPSTSPSPLPSRSPALQPEEDESIGEAAKKIEESMRLPQTQIEETPDIDAPTVKSIVFQTTAQELDSSVVVNLSEEASYKLTRVGQGHHRLLIEGVSLKGRYLTLPQFPPPSFHGFKYIKVEENPDKVIVDMITERSVKLKPYKEDNKIWVKVE